MEQQQQQCHGGGEIIILAVDASKHCDIAFGCYVKHVHRPGFKLHVIHCSEAWASVHPMDGGPSPGHVKELKEKDERAMKDLENKYMTLMKDNNVDGEFHVIGGGKHAWHHIIEYQEKVGGLMIVVGTRGSGAIRRTVMGSVSDSVVHHAHCPVLVCRHE